MELIATNSVALLQFIGHACNNADARQTNNSSFEFVSILSQDGSLSITGSNGSQTFTRICQTEDIQFKGEGQLCVEAAKLFQVVRALPKGDKVKLKIVKNKDRAAITCGRSRLQLRTLDPKQYPFNNVLGEEAARFTVSATSFKAMLNDVSYASGQRDTRNYLNGVNLSIDNGALYSFGCDGHRLCANKIQAPQGTNDMNLLLPINAVKVFTRLSEDTENIEIAFTDSRAEFNWGGLVYRTNLIDEKYPDVKKLIPTNAATSISVNRLDLLETLNRLIVMVSEHKFPRVKVKFNEEQLQFKTMGDKSADAEDGMGIDFVAGVATGVPFDYQYALSPKYLVDALSHMYTENVELKLNGASESCSIVPVGQLTQRALIMPVRV